MASAGANGVTQREILDVLCKGKSEPQLMEHFQRELSRIKGGEWAFRLDCAHKAFVQQGFAIRHEFRHVLEEFYKLEVGIVDFRDPTKAAEEISAFVKDATHGRISRIPLVTGAHAVFGSFFQLADDASVNALALHECKQALETFVKLAQNLHEEITVCGKDHVDLQRHLDLSTLEKNLYKDAYLELLVKLNEQLAAALNYNVDKRKSKKTMSAGKKSL